MQLYSCLLLEGFSRTILTGSLTDKQQVGVILRLYYLALLEWGCGKPSFPIMARSSGQLLSAKLIRVSE